MTRKGVVILTDAQIIELKSFLKIVDRLCIFEAEHMKQRGYGVFTKEERDRFPLPEVVNTVFLLKELGNKLP